MNIKKTIKEFEIKMLEDIISGNDNCTEGYTKCGMLNKKDTYLCLKLTKDEECPINSIIINNMSGILDNYKKFKLGDKYIHFSNNATNNYILENFSFTGNEIANSLDSIPIKKFISYNPNIKKYSNYSNVYLNGEYYTINLNKTEIKNMVERNEKKKKIYSKEKIDGINSNLKKNISVIKNLGLVLLFLIIFFPIIIYIYFSTKEKDFCNLMDSETKTNNICEVIFAVIGLSIAFVMSRICCSLCFKGEFQLKKFAFMLILAFSPILIISIIILIFIINKKSEYTNYLSMEIMEDFLNGNIYDTSINNFNIEFIALIFIMVIFIIYTISIVLIFMFSFTKKENIIHDNENDTYEAPYYEISKNK